ncbi:glycosyltransferase family 1 protein [Thiocapsa imhoffii]|uniref:Glycosyltransferase family 1 protein n=1 Tax=Thiocapsa imhoffii TaxID=382777 RepID=A0A9X1B8M1_9GAMM|nr:glycosyltransferase family 4 protein [Thiocapsa imhoffii]MBK1644912.1 glycosyltransferase family 1 protein [Thiocapsa imhoffii]
MRQRRILYFVLADWYFCTHYLPLARAARAAGFAVTVITSVEAHGDTIRAAGLDLIDLAVSRQGMNPVRELMSLVRVMKSLRRVRPDLLHNIAQKPVLYGTFAARLNGVGAVVNGVAGMGYLFGSDKLRDRVVRALLGGAYRALLTAPWVRVLVQNPDDQRQLERLIGIQPLLIPGSGVDVSAFTPVNAPPGPVVVMLASRMLWDKGVGELVAAARVLKERGSSARFVLVGRPDPGNPASVTATTLEAWHREGCIEWWGYQSDMPAVLAQAHIACLPSYYREGLPKFLLEAAAAGLPLVTTDATGCREAVEPGGNGFLVPIRDTRALVTALEQLIADADLRRRFGLRSRLLALERFDAVRIHDATLRVYQDLLERRERARA